MEVALIECISVTDPSSVGATRRAAQLIGERLQFSAERVGELALLATEVSRNVLLHGGGGQVIVAGLRTEGSGLVQMLAADKGPGVANIAEAMRDGYSTAGTMGTGLGAMKRLASGFEIFTGQGGTVVFLEVGEPARTDDLRVAGFALPYPGERVCGDGLMVHRSQDKVVALMVDGIGHGMGAADAAQEAIQTFKRYAEAGPDEILHRVHDALRKTRGAVGAVAEIRPAEGVMTYAGIGNISAMLADAESSRRLVCHNGTLGATPIKVQEFRFGWSAESILVMHSDGLQTRWELGAYSGLAPRHPAIIAGVLLRDFRRSRDDASVMVIKGK